MEPSQILIVSYQTTSKQGDLEVEIEVIGEPEQLEDLSVLEDTAVSGLLLVVLRARSLKHSADSCNSGERASGDC